LATCPVGTTLISCCLLRFYCLELIPYHLQRLKAKSFPLLLPSYSQQSLTWLTEHFSTPLHYAASYFGLAASLVPFPSGTGHMISALRSGEIDVGIGLTEGWIAGLGHKPAASANEMGGYSLVGTYVETPLCWAISTGANRKDVTDVSSLKGKRMGVSRVGSGSYVMGFVLADQLGWLSSRDETPFDVVPQQTFAKLRAGVNEGTADFFMWEHFTSKRYFTTSAASHGTDEVSAPQVDRIKRIGEIYTPWPSWHIVAHDPKDPRLVAMFEAINKGVQYFVAHPDESVQYISTALDYTEVDATEWLKTVRFAKNVKGVQKSVVDSTISTLRKAGVLTGTEDTSGAMIGIRSDE
jgi:ABC-type nitrate/sulfonate/bicarbonate transport system substrate-binding protein